LPSYIRLVNRVFYIPAALMQLANYFNFIIPTASKEPMTRSVLK
jgi:hypothetical protein